MSQRFFLYLLKIKIHIIFHEKVVAIADMSNEVNHGVNGAI